MDTLKTVDRIGMVKSLCGMDFRENRERKFEKAIDLSREMAYNNTVVC